MLWQRDPTGDAPLSFHGLPLHDPDTLRLWLIALGMDPDSSMDTIRTLRVCSQHFSKDDFCPSAGSRHAPVLKSTAVPAAARGDATVRKTRVYMQILVTYHSNLTHISGVLPA